MKHNQIQSILYHIKQTDLQINVIVKDESIWATQKAIAGQKWIVILRNWG